MSGHILAIYPISAEASTIVVDEPSPCGQCNAMHAIFVNRLGSTKCYECDHQEQKAKGAAA